jgi:5-formyltetrahydrofolate cyclo-ligase
MEPRTGRADDAGLRARCRAARRSLDARDRSRAEAAVARRLRQLLDGRPPGRIGGYVATDGELDPAGALSALEAGGWAVLLPVVGDGRSMSFAPYTAGEPLRPNRFGIPEPTRPASVAPAELDVVLVPCVALDRRGHRLGFGQGYYDRALADAPRTLKVGLVHDVQLVGSIEPEPWDVRMDVVLSPSELHDRR